MDAQFDKKQNINLETAMENKMKLYIIMTSHCTSEHNIAMTAQMYKPKTITNKAFLIGQLLLSLRIQSPAEHCVFSVT